MSRFASVVVPGDPQGKPRPRFDGRSGRTYTPTKYAKYEKLIGEEFRKQNPDWSPAETAISVSIYAGFRIPGSWSKRKRNDAMFSPVTKKPDADNIIKAALDGLNGTAYTDDALVYCVYFEKVYTSLDPYLQIEIEVEEWDLSS